VAAGREDASEKGRAGKRGKRKLCRCRVAAPAVTRIKGAIKATTATVK